MALMTDRGAHLYTLAQFEAHKALDTTRYRTTWRLSGETAEDAAQRMLPTTLEHEVRECAIDILAGILVCLP